jgi:DNA-directed RNA polymerase subunit RPC12/RpoP
MPQASSPADTFSVLVGVFVTATLGMLWWRRRLGRSLPPKIKFSSAQISSTFQSRGKPAQIPRPASVAPSAIGRLDNVCPSCGAILAERPARKTKCPHCGSYIFVRTRPLDRQRVLVTEEQARNLEAQWAGFPRERIAPMLNQKEMEELRPVLAKQFGKPPSDTDVAWAYLNQKTLQYMKHRQWGLYRNARLSMGAVLENEGKLEAALRHYLEVCFLDLNGPQNRGTIITNGEPRVAPGHDFSLKDAFLAPAVVGKIKEVTIRLQLSELQVKDHFMYFAEREMRGLLPLTPDQAWDKLSAALYE